MPTPIGSLVLQVHGDTTPLARSISAAAAEGNKAIRSALNQPLGRITGQSNEFQKSLAASNARVIAFGASAGSIFAVRAAFQKLVSSTIEVERQMAEINTLFGLGSRQLQAFSSQLFQIANQVSVTFSEATKAANAFAHQGLTVEETLKRTSAALAMSKISGMGMEESVMSLTATINSFTKESLTAIDVVDRLTAISSAYAVAEDDLAEGLKRVAATANDANISLNQTIALITAAQQVTMRGGSVLGNAFKSIFTRMQRPKVLEDLEAMGIQVRNAEGTLLPMIEVLRNLSSTYDRLSRNQKSFIAETVGGVYQINVLKAVLGDVKSGVSAFEGAMNTASASTGTTQKRLEILNQTISSHLTRTMNELTRASSNIGNVMLAPGMKGGMNGFEKLLKNLADLSDENAAREGSMTKQFGANIFQGALRGAGNILEGPGVQFIVFTLIKLFERLEKFVIDSAKDITGLNQKEKEREAINESIANYLNEQKEVLQGVISGTISAEEATAKWLEKITNVRSVVESIAVASRAMGGIALNQVSIGTVSGKESATFARGYIPNLYNEVTEARQGGYNAGRVVSTTVREGSKIMRVTANTNETKATIYKDGLPYDFINPPKNSRAGFLHAHSSPINPYDLPQRGVLAASGFAPNLSVEEIEASLAKMGLSNWKELSGIQKTDPSTGKVSGLHKNFNLEWIPEAHPFIMKVIDKYQLSGKDVLAFLRSLSIRANTKENARLAIQKGMSESFADESTNGGKDNDHRFFIPSTPLGYYAYLRGFATNPTAIKEGLVSNLRQPGTTRLHSENVAQFISDITGKQFEPPIEEEGTEPFSMTKEQADKILARYASTFKTIAAYQSTTDLRPAQDEPDFMSTVKTKSGDFTFNTPIYGHKTFFNQFYSKAREGWKNIWGLKRQTSVSKFARQFGEGFNDWLNEQAEEAGIPITNQNAAIDIPGAPVSILKDTNITGPVSGIEAKGSVFEAKQGSLGPKIFKSLIGDPAGERLTGPTEVVPPLANVPQFKNQGATGILDFDEMTSRSRKEFHAAITQAIADGKPIKIFHGPRGSGQSAAAKKLYGAGSVVKSIDDLPYFDQFVLTSASRVNVSSGIPGLAFAAASQIEEFRPSTNMVYDEKQLAEYKKSMAELKQRFGDRYIPHQYARGFRPNLAISLDEVYSRLQKTTSSPKWQMGKISNNPHALKMFEEGWDFLGSGAESIAFKKDNLVFKVPRRDEVSDAIPKKTIASIQANALFKMAGLGITSARAREAIIGGDKGLLQRYSGPTLGNVLGEQNPELMYSLLNFIDQRVSSIPYHTNKNLGNGVVIGVDAASEHNFTVGDKERLIRVSNKIKEKNINIENNARLQAALIRIGKLKAIDIGGYSSGLIPNLSTGTKYTPLSEVKNLQLRHIASGLGINPKNKPEEIADSVAQKYPETFKRLWLNGLVNFDHPAGEALQAEMNATGGFAELSSSKKLVSASNKLGLVAIDPRYQKSGDDAISQHKALGQSINEIKNKRSASGYVPNLAINNEGFFSSAGLANSVVLALGDYGSQLMTTVNILDKFKKGMGRLISEEERTSMRIRDLNKEYEKARDSILSPQKTGTFQGKEFSKVTELEKAASNIIKPLQETNRDYEERKSRERDSLKTEGRTLAMRSAIFGGMATQFVSKYSPTAGAATEEFTAGIQTAGQALMAFPTQLGKSMAVGIAAASVASTFDVLNKNLANQRAAYDVSTSRFQKLSAQVDSISTALNNFDNLISDSSVSLETLVREERKYSELVGQMGSTPEGHSALLKLIGASDSRTKVARLAEVKADQSRSLDRDAALLGVREYASKKTFMKFGDAFGYSNDIEKNQVKQLIQGTSTTAIASMEPEDKARLMSLAHNPTDFFVALEASSNKINSVFGAFIKDLEGTIGTSNMRQINESIRRSLATERAYSSPEGQANLKGLHQRNASRQLQIDAAARLEAFMRRMFVNQGALQSSNTLDVRSIAQQKRYDAQQVAFSKAESMSGLFGMQYGDRTMQEYQAGIDFARIENERQNKIENLNINTTRSITDAVTQNFDQYLKNEDMFKNLGPQGQTAIPNIPQYKAELISALNTGISETVKAGNFDRFKVNGQLDQAQMINEIVDRASNDSRQRNSVRAFLQSNASIDILKTISNANLELVNINQTALTEDQKRTNALEAIRAGIRQRESSSFLGGMQSLVDRNARRQMERDAIRGAILMRRGSSDEVRGMGGAAVLDWFKKNNVPINLSGETSLSKLMVEAWNNAKAGFEQSSGKTQNRMLGSMSLLAGETSTQGFAAYMNRDVKKAAEDAARERWRPEGSASDLLKQVGVNTGNFSEMNRGIQIALDSATNDVLRFGSTLNITSKQLLQTVEKTAALRAQMEKETKADNAKAQKRIATPYNAKEIEEQQVSTWDVLKGMLTNATDTQLSQGSGGSIPLATYMPTAIMGATMLGAQAFLQRRLVASLAKSFISGSGSVSSIPQLGVFSKMGQWATTMKPDRLSQGISTTVNSMTGSKMSLSDYQAWKQARASNPKLTLKEFLKPVTTPETVIKSGYVGSPKAGEKAIIEQAMKDAANTKIINERVKSAEASAITIGKSRGNEKRAMRAFQENLRYQNWLENNANPVEAEEPIKRSLTSEERRRRYSPQNPASRTARAANAYYWGNAKRMALGVGIAGLLSFLGTSQANAGEMPTNNVSAQPNNSLLPNLAIGTAANMAMFHTGWRKDVSNFRGTGGKNLGRSLAKGGILAGADIGGNMLIDKFLRPQSETAANIASGGLGISSAALLMGLTRNAETGKLGFNALSGLRGGAGMGLGILSDISEGYLKNKGYNNTGNAVGLMGSVGSGAMMGGPIMAAISGGMWGYRATKEARAENAESIGISRAIDDEALMGMQDRLAQRLSSGDVLGGLDKYAQELSGRINQLKNYKEADNKDNEGLYNKLTKFVRGPSQFGAKEIQALNAAQAEFARVQTLQRNVQSNPNYMQEVFGTGDNNGLQKSQQAIIDQFNTLKAQEGAIQNSFEAQQKAEQTQARLVGALEKIATMNEKPIQSGPSEVKSTVTVEISLKDADKMPDILTAKLIQPLAKQLSDLENRVNILTNNIAPQPAKVK